MFQPRQTFGMADEKITPLVQAVEKPVDKAVLGCFIKIDHYVAAKDNVAAKFSRRQFHEVEAPKIDKLAKFLFYPEQAGGSAGAVLEMTAQDVFGYLFYFFFRIDATECRL